MARSSVWKVIQRDLEHFGVLRTACDVTFRAINLCCYFRVLRALKLEQVHPGFGDAMSVNWQFLNAEQLETFAKDPANELSEAFLSAALAKGDQCYAALDGSRLAAYSWYSHEPTEADGLRLTFRPDYVYMYKAFTHPDYRGRRLYAAGVNRALTEYLAQGYRGLIADVEIYNYGSLRSLERLGCEGFGRTSILKIGKRSLVLTSPGCRAYGYAYRTGEELAALAC